MKKARLFHLLPIIAFIAAAMISIAGCGNRTATPASNENEDTDSAYTQRLSTLMDYFNKRQTDSVAYYASMEMERCKAHEQWFYYYYNWAIWGRALAADAKTDEANALLKEMTADAVKRNNKIGEAMSHMTMGAIYMLCNQDDAQAEKTFRLFLDTYPEDADYSPKDWVYTMLIQLVSHTTRDDEFKALLDKQKEEMEKAGNVVKNGKRVCETKSYRTWRSNYYYNLYFYYIKTRDIPKATASLDTIDNILKEDTLRRATWLLGPRLALLVNTNRLDSALSLLDNEKDVLHRTYEGKKLWTHYKYHLNKFNQDAPEALFYLEKLKEMSDSAASADTRAKLDELNKRFEIDSVKHQAELQKSRFATIIAIGIAVALALLLGLGLWSRSRLRKKNTELREAYDQLEETTTIKERIESELRIARDIQMSMVPSQFPDYEGLDMYASMTPAKEVGGDLYGYVLLGDKLYFAVGDVSGKGVPASLFMAQATRLFRTLAAQQMMPAEICTRMNDALSGDDNESGMFVTLFLGLLDLKSGHLDFCNAGHNQPIIGGGDSHGDFLEMNPNAPIGLWPGLQYEGEQIADIKGHPLFIYTDGLNEAENKQQEQFGDDRLLEFLRHTHLESAKQVVDTLKAEVEKHRAGAEPNDDLTMMCLTIN